MTSPAQTRAIHAMRKAGQMDDREYRALLAARFGKTSSADLTGAEASVLIDELRAVTGVTPAAGRSAARTATGKFAPVLRALWICAWRLGLARSRDDAALLAFVERQTGLTHSRFLTDAADATRAIEGLKAWIARDGGVIWPAHADARATGRPLSWLRKQAVAEAAIGKLSGGGDPAIGGSREAEAFGAGRGLPTAFAAYSEADWDTFAAFLGERLQQLGDSTKAKNGKRRSA